ncbi:MAG: signal transduction histidine kinase [Cocleimonas sp.]|jgi:signal transduction histidine kinase
MPQRKLIILLSLLVILPLSLLAWQGWKISQDKQKLNDVRFTSLVAARLNQVDTVVQSYFEEMQLQWSLLIPQWQLDSETTRERIENDGNIRQIFVLDPQRIRSFPPLDKDITAAERVFVDRLATVWDDPEILFSNQISAPSVEQVASLNERLKTETIITSATPQKKSLQESRAELIALDSVESSMALEEIEAETMVMADDIVADNIGAVSSIAAQKNSDLPSPTLSGSSNTIALDSGSTDYSLSKRKPAAKISKKSSSLSSSDSNVNQTLNSTKQGWYMWHWGNDSNLIFWQEGKDNSIVGVEMDPIRVKSDLISRLPDTVPGENTDFRLRLIDSSGQVVYQWGNFQALESQNDSKQMAQQRRALSYPLSSWSLEYYGEPFSQSDSSRYNLLLSLLGFALLLSALAWFLYREQTREMRLAEKRVNFVSQVSHELKTPLTNIRMYAEMLEAQIEDEEQPKRYLQVITDESKRLTRLIYNVLNFSHEPRIHKREINADEIIRQSIKHFAPSFKAKQFVLNADLNADEMINSDPDILEQILNNLLSNVEKYASNAKRLDIKSEINHGLLVIRMRDYGSGISRAERKQIFKPFYRIDDKITEGVSGTGIGLTIARQQAEHLGGSLEYVDVNEGACFELKLPVGEN